MTKKKAAKGAKTAKKPSAKPSPKPSPKPSDAVTDVLTRVQSRLDGLTQQLETQRRNIRQSNADRREAIAGLLGRIQRVEQQLGIEDVQRADARADARAEAPLPSAEIETVLSSE